MCNCQGPKDDVDVSLVDPILEAYGHEAGNTITILQKTQEVYGYLPYTVLERISEKTGISQAKLYGVATFYAQFRMAPAGKHLIMLCQGTACHVNGADIVQDAISETLKIQNGETTEDGLFSLQIVACLGCCSLAPVMVIDGKTYGKLDGDKVVKILDDIRKKEAENE
ncbi:NADH-quinone oxidoreductase subunit NuoE [Guggenheimella bovis]